MSKKLTMDGNMAAAHVAYAFSDVAAIYPITPSSDMGQYADLWASQGRKNVFGQILNVTEMQSEAGAAGAVHGALSAGAFTTTFTASQGLLLMLPNMHKIAGEMLPTVFHVSARSLACQSLSIFGDHSDVMSARNTGFALMAASNCQEIMDLAVVSHLATLKGRVPFLNFFDGFRNSHEISKLDVFDYDEIKGLLEMKYVKEFRSLALNPQKPMVKVAAQNPDVYFQGRETVNNYYAKLPEIVLEYMDKVAKLSGRSYKLFDYVGAPDATKVIICMGSGAATVEETVNYLVDKGEKVGLVKIRLYRPFSIKHFKDALPSTVKEIVALDRTKEPGSIGEPLYMDVVAALVGSDIKVVGGRYGLSSKEFTPSMVNAIFDKAGNGLKHGFTVGIDDDLSGTSIKVEKHINTLTKGTVSCKFWGLGADGTVGANKNSIKIIGDNTDMYAQGYFQYDSKKSGGVTRSHLRFGKTPILAEYLIVNADFIACHNPAYIGRYDLLEGIKEGGIFLLNSQFSQEEVFSKLTKDMQETIIKKKIRFYNVNALKIARECGLGGRINTVMQAAFFAISEILPREEAITLIKEAIKKTYLKKKGQAVVDMNWKAVDEASKALTQIDVPASASVWVEPKRLVPADADDFTKSVIEPIMHEKGDEIPVSKMPLDGCMYSGTAAMEKRGVAAQVPSWIAENCIQCNACSLVCPHAAIRPKLIAKDSLADKPAEFTTITAMGKDGDKYEYRMQVFVDDCLECGACINSCPKGALVFKPVEEELVQRENLKYFQSKPEDVCGDVIAPTTIKGSQFKQPLLEFSGACAGCGETPYVKLLTQLFGNRMLIANATGCSSIWGGTFPSIPYCKNKDGYGPAWANSLFEDNAEYGLGFRLAVNSNRANLKFNIEAYLQEDSTSELAKLLKDALANFDAKDEDAMSRAAKIRELLPSESKSDSLSRVIELQHYFVDKSVWAFGGDGWAYDIGFGGLDHALATGKNINILVMDTEVYSNTGGQASKATPIGAIAKFAEAGKPLNKKDLGQMMMSYGYVYVASCAMGADRNQLIKAMREAEAYDGPSILFVYSPCINHGIDMSNAQAEEKLAVDTGYWPLYRYNPALTAEGKNPFILESKPPVKDVKEFLQNEKRYTSLMAMNKEKAEKYWKAAQDFVNARYDHYKKLAD